MKTSFFTILFVAVLMSGLAYISYVKGYVHGQTDGNPINTSDTCAVCGYKLSNARDSSFIQYVQLFEDTDTRIKILKYLKQN